MQRGERVAVGKDLLLAAIGLLKNETVNTEKYFSDGTIYENKIHSLTSCSLAGRRTPRRWTAVGSCA
jgi:hypothetical protein